MADGEGSETETSGGVSPGGSDTPPPMPHRRIDPVAPTLLGGRHPVERRGRPRWSTVALILAFTAALVLYLALRPGG